MAEALSPNPKPKHRPPFASPAKSPFFLGANNDELERAQARAAAFRRNTAAPSLRYSAAKSAPYLGKNQILELFRNCVKLATENRITQKNTWELNLIDYFVEIINSELENDSETNFQKASCTLEAGVKIYSMRVDSLYCDAYKVLTGINRVGKEDGQDHVADDSNVSNGQAEIKGQKDQQKKLSPLSTVESSFAALNVKKFDIAFAIDPLYHQMSSQFDEGGAKGLLLNNLGVYANCRILFDSLEVPGKCEPLSQSDVSGTIDMSFAKDCIEPMVSSMLSASDISPSLGDIVNQFDNDNQRPSEVYSSQANENLDDNHDLGGDFCSFDHNDQASFVDEGMYDHDPSFSSHQDVSSLGNELLDSHDAVEDENFEGVDDYISLSLGFSMIWNAWAGPSHWKYQMIKDLEGASKENGSNKTNNKKADTEIDFLSVVNMDHSHIFVPPKNPKTLLLPGNRKTCNTKLPEDCHYQPEDLVKLFLLPNVLCLGRSGRNGRKRTDKASQHADICGETTSWNEEDYPGGTFDDGYAYSGNEESSTLVSQPRQVNKIEVHYDKRSKQVDVHVLKATLWDHMLGLNGSSVQEEASEDTISFKRALASFPDGCGGAGSPDDISPHLCFICLLHLANEHGLQISGRPSLDDLCIHFRS